MMRSLKILIPVVVAIVVLFWPGHGRAQLATIIPTPLPTPAPAPTIAPINITRTFHCNCTSPGNPVLWAGNVQATGFFQARQMGTSQCLAYIGAKPGSPLYELRVQLTTGN
jgi:hypothetical protein